jgi:Protein of unknown function (DUF3570)
MVAKPAEVVDVIKKNEMKNTLAIIILFTAVSGFAQEYVKDSTKVYKNRVLDNVEVDFLTSYYSQDGDNAAVSGGLGTEKLTDFTATFVVSIPLNDDDILTIDGGISAYSSASASNVNPFNGKAEADPFVASSGSSKGDLWKNITGSYSHSSDDRNNIWSAKVSVSSEYDYLSFGFGGSYTKLFNEKNTSLSVHANVYLDTWKLIYPIELRPFTAGGAGIDDELFTKNPITGNPNYNPSFTELDNKTRNSYSLGFGFSQILSKKLQGSIEVDFVQQQGLLSTPFHRIYFSDVDASYIENFHLADDIERMPDSRFKVAIGGRLNYFINEIFVVRTYYRYYTDNWDIRSHTASIEIPIKIADRFTLYPSYRFYNQTATKYFAPYNQHLSTEDLYTSDYDLSKYTASQYGFGVSYTDIFTKFHIFKFGLKSVDLKYHQYQRDSGLKASIITGGFKFIMD